MVILTLLGALLVLAAVWAVDTAVNGDRVARNVTLADVRVGNMEPAELSNAVGQLAQRYAEAKVQIEAPGGEFTVAAPEFGLSLRQDMTVAAVLDVGRHGFVGKRMFEWARSFISSREAPVVILLDERSVARVAATRDPKREPPVEPGITAEGEAVVAVPGKPGLGIDPGALSAALAEEVPKGLPIKVSVERTSVPPRFGVEDAEALASQAEELAAPGLPVTVGAASATVPASAIRRWVRAVPSEDSLGLGIDVDSIADTLGDLLPGATTPAVDAGFRVDGSRVVITPSRAGTACCAPEAAAIVHNALLDRRSVTTRVVLPVRSVPPKRTEADAQRLGIVAPVGSFTTSHPPGEPRVKNIHLMADLVRGALIAPGETFSLNRRVGPRTGAKGFVEAPVIGEKSTFEKSIGGGVSQFATTMFNAAFLAGFDIPEYMMHTLYISRYPYGREATLSYPAPDLKVRNNSGHGVLVWATYNATSITVTLYSSKFADVSMGNQTKRENGPCTIVTTERTRRFLGDGRTSVDRFRGQYAPKEGVECPR